MARKRKETVVQQPEVEFVESVEPAEAEIGVGIEVEAEDQPVDASAARALESRVWSNVAAVIETFLVKTQEQEDGQPAAPALWEAEIPSAQTGGTMYVRAAKPWLMETDKTWQTLVECVVRINGRQNPVCQVEWITTHQRLKTIEAVVDCSVVYEQMAVLTHWINEAAEAALVASEPSSDQDSTEVFDAFGETEVVF